MHWGQFWLDVNGSNPNIYQSTFIFTIYIIIEKSKSTKHDYLEVPLCLQLFFLFWS